MAQVVTTAASRLTAWRARAAASPLLADALAACMPANEAECADVLDLLAMLGCDVQTQAAAVWFELAVGDPQAWQARAPSLPLEVQRLVEGQLAAQKVWALHAQRENGAHEGLRRL